jgi:uncharacterized membrane protein YedE/YeeE
MRNIPYLLVGTFFGAILYKGEAISWFRIQEMFRFQSFHMYGVLFSAVAISSLSILVIRHGTPHEDHHATALTDKTFHHGIWIGGIIFGMGWALTGACPGPMFAHLGAGTSVMVVALISAILGTWVYSALRPKLLH